jgi:hypothetical protein
MTTNLPIAFAITAGGCPGDISGPGGFEAPDGQVDTGDLQALVGKLIAAGAPYIITPIPADLEAANISGPGGFEAPDGQVDTGDLQALVGYLIGVGAPYIGDCIVLP